MLDAGAGTGLIGEWLRIAGYAPVEGVDLSPGMLAVAARARGSTTGCAQADLTARLPFEDGRFAGAVCAGVFTTGHVGAEGLDELLRVLRPGGVLVLTVKDKTWEDGFAARVAALAADGAVGSPRRHAPLQLDARPRRTTPRAASRASVRRTLSC